MATLTFFFRAAAAHAQVCCVACSKMKSSQKLIIGIPFSFTDLLIVIACHTFLRVT